jgi:hypothetical protein
MMRCRTWQFAMEDGAGMGLTAVNTAEETEKDPPHA